MADDCGNCRFYRDQNRHSKTGYGECRRYPEHVKTNDGRWCGEHQAAPTTDADQVSREAYAEARDLGLLGY